MLRIIYLLVCIIFSYSVYSKDLINNVLYYRHIFGVIHKNKSKYSDAIVTIQCGQRLEVINKYSNWLYVRAGGYKGYVREYMVDNVFPLCLQKRYQNFITDVGLTPSEYYYWGKLYDYYLEVIPRAK